MLKLCEAYFSFRLKFLFNGVIPRQAKALWANSFRKALLLRPSRSSMVREVVRFSRNSGSVDNSAVLLWGQAFWHRSQP